jgi:squalene-associated FAD-dependent desaturase
MAYGMAWLACSRDERPGEPFEDWLVRHGQGERVIKLFWETVLVSALNERVSQLDVAYARKVFLDGFLRNRDAYQIDLPLVPLGELYGTRLENWLNDHGVTVRLKTGVRTIEYDDESSVYGVKLRSGESVAGDFVVLAVPFKNVLPLVPEHVRRRLPALEVIESIQASPITGVHIWFDRAICPFDHVATPGRLVQWIFNHTAIQGRVACATNASVSDAPTGGVAPPNDQGQYLQVVISASYELLALDNDAIRDAVLSELAEMWPAAKTANVIRSWVVVERGATFAARPGVDALRPMQHTSVDGLILAGDWTQTNWPATMEGAVRSGYLAAEVALRMLDRPTRLVRPDLKPDLLARWLLGAPESSSSKPRAFTPSMPRPLDAV